MEIKQMLLGRNYSSRYGTKIDRIVIHHMAGNLSLTQLKSVFLNRKGSAQYGIDSNGNIGQFVPDGYRAWTTGTYKIDNRSITIEVANDSGEPNWHVSDKALRATIELVAYLKEKYPAIDIEYVGNTSAGLQMHKWWASTACPGPYLSSKFKYISDEAKKLLTKPNKTYRVQVGVFSVKANADKLAAELKAKGYQTIVKEE